MKIRILISIGIVPFFLTGCLSVPPQGGAPQTYNLQPALSPIIPLQIYVQDTRPVLEIEKKPTTDYLYSGAVFNAEDGAETVRMDLRNMVITFGGTQNAESVLEAPTNGVAILFNLEHWYSKTALKPTTSPIIVMGAFGGDITLESDGKILAVTQIEAQGTPTVIDSYTPQLVTRGMENTANSAQQKGYAQIMSFLQKNWAILGSSNQ